LWNLMRVHISIAYIYRVHTLPTELNYAAIYGRD
jgi:hypothetical protein